MCKSLNTVNDIILLNRIAYGIQQLLKYIYKPKKERFDELPKDLEKKFPKNVFFYNIDCYNNYTILENKICRS